MLYALFDRGSYSHGRVECNGRILDRLDHIEPCVLCRRRMLDAQRCWCYSIRPENSWGDLFSTSLLVLGNKEDWQMENLNLQVASP